MENKVELTLGWVDLNSTRSGKLNFHKNQFDFGTVFRWTYFYYETVLLGIHT